MASYHGHYQRQNVCWGKRESCTGHILAKEKRTDNWATTIDEMLLILKMVADQSSLAEVAIFVASMTLKDRNMSQRFDIVFYADKETSFKNSERLARSDHSSTNCKAVGQWYKQVKASYNVQEGKIRPLKFLNTNKEYQDSCVYIGEEWDVNEQLMDKLENFTCLIYASKSGQWRWKA